MPLLLLIFIFFLFKCVLQLPFYFKSWRQSLLLAVATSMAVVPLLFILYHETSLDFLLVYFVMLLGDIFLYYYLLKPNWWKAIPTSFVINTITILIFCLVEG